jgi:hypothetical protein
LYALTFYLALSLVDGRARYYLFLLPFYTAAAVLFLTTLDRAIERVRAAGGADGDPGQELTSWADKAWRARCPPSTLALSACLLLSLWGTRQALSAFLASEPRELTHAAATLGDSKRPGERVMARTCHVAVLAGLESEWLPNVADVPALGRYLAGRGVTYLVYGPAEQEGRPQLAALRDPALAPPWLQPLYVDRSGKVALYRVVTARLPKAGPADSYVTPSS